MIEISTKIQSIDIKLLAMQRQIDMLQAMSARQKAEDQNANTFIGRFVQILKNILRNGFLWFGFKVDVDHGLVLGLEDDDHKQYFLLAGRAGGQEAIGGTQGGDRLTLKTTSHATKGEYVLSDLTPAGYVRVGTGGVLSSTTVIYPTVYNQTGEPSIPENSIALWFDTSKYYLLANFGGTQKKVELT